MDNLLLHLALLTVGTDGLIVAAVPLTVPLYFDRSYVDGSSCVVFIIDTTTRIMTCQLRLMACNSYLPCTIIGNTEVRGVATLQWYVLSKVI
jgi:hypothetical protein